jgi:hypothetical protein
MRRVSVAYSRCAITADGASLRESGALLGAHVVDRKTWEGSIAVRRSDMPIYGALPRHEDTEAIEWFQKTHRDLAYIDCPLLYVYAVTGRKYIGSFSFRGNVFRFQCIFEGDQFDELNELLADRSPLLKYSELLQYKEVL